MNSNFRCNTFPWIMATLLLNALLSACTTAWHQHSVTNHRSDNHHAHHQQAQSTQYTNKQNAVTQTSESGRFRVSLYSNQSPIPIQSIHSWTVHVENQQGKAFENGKLYVFGGMPMHNHGFPTKPKVTRYLGNGNYQVDGIKFNMHGHWQMRFNIQQGRTTDRVVFEIEL